MFVVSLPIRGTAVPQVETDVVAQECIIAAKGKSWNISLALVCSASPVLKELLGPTVEKSNEIPVLSINYEQPQLVETFVKYLQTSDLSDVNLESCGYDKVVCLKHYADLYVLAGNIEMRELQEVAVERWSSVAGGCLFGAFSIAALLGLIQHIYSQMPHDDINFRLEILQSVASYRQRCLRMARSLNTKAEVKSKCGPEICEQVLEYERHSPDLDSFLLSREPLAWKLAKMYEEEMQVLVDRYKM